MKEFLDGCPMPECKGELQPHCESRSCDTMTCDRCGEQGTLDGLYWPTPFAQLEQTVNALRADVAASEVKVDA